MNDTVEDDQEDYEDDEGISILFPRPAFAVIIMEGEFDHETKEVTNRKQIEKKSNRLNFMSKDSKKKLRDQILAVDDDFLDKPGHFFDDEDEDLNEIVQFDVDELDEIINEEDSDDEENKYTFEYRNYDNQATTNDQQPAEPVQTGLTKD